MIVFCRRRVKCSGFYVDKRPVRLCYNKFQGIMDKKTKKAVGWIVAVIAVAGLAWFWIYWQQRPARLDEFARCLKDRGAIFYGAFWCPHCQNQKTMFGRSSRLLPYVEC